jgi:hypothetical protein
MLMRFLLQQILSELEQEEKEHEEKERVAKIKSRVTAKDYSLDPLRSQIAKSKSTVNTQAKVKIYSKAP